MENKIIDFFKGIFEVFNGFIGIIIFGLIGLYILDSCAKDTNTTNLTFKKNKINICNEEIELYDFINDEEFDSIQFEEYTNEICIENPEKE